MGRHPISNLKIQFFVGATPGHFGTVGDRDCPKAGIGYIESHDDEASICSFIMSSLFYNKAADTLIGGEAL
jgi:hypothetical protein